MDSPSFYSIRTISLDGVNIPIASHRLIDLGHIRCLLQTSESRSTRWRPRELSPKRLKQKHWSPISINMQFYKKLASTEIYPLCILCDSVCKTPIIHIRWRHLFPSTGHRRLSWLRHVPVMFVGWTRTLVIDRLVIKCLNLMKISHKCHSYKLYKISKTALYKPCHINPVKP